MSSIDAFVHSVESALQLPISASYSNLQVSQLTAGLQNLSIQPQYGLCSDAAVLVCGCIVSEKLANGFAGKQCPVCSAPKCVVLAPVPSLRKIYELLQKYEAETTPKPVSRTYARRGDRHSLLSLFKAAALQIKDEDMLEEKSTLEISSSLGRLEDIEEKRLTEDRLDDAGSLPRPGRALAVSLYLTRSESQRSGGTVERILRPRELFTLLFSSTPAPIIIPKNSAADQISAGNTPSSLHFSHVLTPPGSHLEPEKEEDFSKEILFANNFPVYRKRVQYPVGLSKVKSLLKRSDYIGTAISPDATKFALLEDKKWSVYNITDSAPELLCCGKNNGYYGPTMDDLRKLNPKFYTPDRLVSVVGDPSVVEMVERGAWSFEYCALGHNYLVIAGKKIIKVFDLRRLGKPVYTHNIGLPIRCVDIAPDDRFIACGLTGRDKATDLEGSLIMLFQLFCNYKDGPEISGSEGDRIYGDEEYAFSHATSSLITLHYKDPINIVRFSKDGALMAVSTALESRFMVISLSKPSDPRLVMKASRKLDTSYESEGITDLCFFGDNNKYMTVSSVAFNAPLLVLDTRISTLRDAHLVAHPKVLMKLEEAGSSIHRCCVSPRNDAFAFLTKKGYVYLVSINKNFERKRAVLADCVMSATKKSEAASLQFSKDGYKLYVVDRKGILYVEDFVAGTPQSHDVSKCKSIV